MFFDLEICWYIEYWWDLSRQLDTSDISDISVFKISSFRKEVGRNTAGDQFYGIVKQKI